MNRTDTLRAIVARLGNVEPAQVGANFSLQTAALKGSIKRAALAAAIRRDLGINSSATHSVATFGELERAVLGEASLPITHTTPPSQSPAVSPVVLTARPLETSVRCGVDIEMVSELPEAADYREHEFYKDSFTPAEIAYCLLQEAPRMHFAARWCAKEALAKCDSSFRFEKPGNLEVTRSEQGEVSLRHRVNGSSVPLPHSLSISHTNEFATAVVVCGSSSSVPSVPPLGSGVSPKPVTDPAPGSSIALLGVLAWMLSFGVALLALIRTFR